MDYRPVDDDDVFHEFVGYAFAPERGPDRELDEDGPDPPWQRRGLYLEGDETPVSVASYFELDARLRNVTVPTAGISTVATPPEHRRQGYVRALLTEMLRETRAEGLPFTALWPFEHPFYRKLGWGTAHRLYRVEGQPDAFRAAARDGGQWHRADADDWARLDAVHATNAHELAVDRTEDWWRETIFQSWDGERYAYYHETDGSPDAYVVYTVKDDGPTLNVLRADARSGAWGHVWRFLADHDSQMETVTLFLRDAAILDAVDDPADLEVELKAGGMVRPADVPGTLSALRYPADADLTIEVEDPLGVTGGTFAVRVVDGTADVTAAPGATPDATLSIGTLGQLVVGYRPVGALIPEMPADARESLATLFPRSDPFLGEWF